MLAYEKDLTDVIDLEDITMSSGGLRGAKGTVAPGPRFLVAEKGPVLRKTFELNHRKTFEYTLCFLLMFAGTHQTRGVGV